MFSMGFKLRGATAIFRYFSFSKVLERLDGGSALKSEDAYISAMQREFPTWISEIKKRMLELSAVWFFWVLGEGNER